MQHIGHKQAAAVWMLGRRALPSLHLRQTVRVRRDNLSQLLPRCCCWQQRKHTVLFLHTQANYWDKKPDYRGPLRHEHCARH